MLIQKTLLQIEGVGRQLYPELDLWKTAQPLLRQWAHERWKPRNVWREVRAQLPDFVQALAQVPPLFENAVQRASDGRLRLQVEATNLDVIRNELRNTGRRRDLTIVGSIGAMSGILWLALYADPARPGLMLAIACVATLAFRRLSTRGNVRARTGQKALAETRRLAKKPGALMWRDLSTLSSLRRPGSRQKSARHARRGLDSGLRRSDEG